MIVLSVSHEQLVRTTQVIQLNDGRKITVIDLYSGRKIVDSIYRDENGNNIDDADLIETIDTFLTQ